MLAYNFLFLVHTNLMLPLEHSKFKLSLPFFKLAGHTALRINMNLNRVKITIFAPIV